MKPKGRLTQGVYYSRDDCAGFWRRLVVAVIDFIVLTVAVLAITTGSAFLLPNWGPVVVRIFFWSGMTLGFLYLVALKGSRFRTLGYRVGGVRIVNIQGERSSIGALTLRALFAFWGPLNLLIDLLWITSDERRQSLRDKLAHTYVIRARATPAGQGAIVYTACTVSTVHFLFAEVLPAGNGSK